jgi:hypothetical protein
MRRSPHLSIADSLLLPRGFLRRSSPGNFSQRPCPAAVDQPGGGRERLVSSVVFERGQVELPHCPPLIKPVELEGHAISSKLSQSMKELEKAGTACHI